MTFSEYFNKWRGRRTHKECAEILKVPFWTIVRWASRGGEPSDYPDKERILKRMEDNPE